MSEPGLVPLTGRAPSQIVRLSSALDERRLRTSFLRAVQSSAAEATAANFRLRAAAAAAAAAQVAQRSPTAQRRPSGTQRRSRPTVTTLYGSDGLEEILYQELRRGGAVPTKLDRWWCVSGVAGVHPRSASRVIHSFALITDKDFAEFNSVMTAPDELSEYVQALLEPHALHKAVSALRAKMKVQRYNLRSSSDRTLDLKKVLGPSIRQGIDMKIGWRFDEKRPDVTLVVHLGRDYLAMGLEDARCQVRPSEALRGAMAFLASEAARGHAVVDPCCGQGSLLKLAQELWPKEPSRMLGQDVRQAALARAAEIGGRLELSRGDGGDLPLGDGEADAFLSDLPNAGTTEERSLLCQRVVAEASRVLRPDGRLVLMTGSPELLAQEVVKGAWRTVGAWPIRRRRATRSEEKVEQLVCLEKAAEEPKKAPKDLALKEESAPKKSEEIKALWERLGI
ncbi:unnamed protein product [Durusdinium trenchii]|uniref:Methyltransferase domain-containing protein n=1 Tax=Durusdinium trenchii TaxID=1381693 RepID=A0ABP0JJ56_9DINO